MHSHTIHPHIHTLDIFNMEGGDISLFIWRRNVTIYSTASAESVWNWILISTIQLSICVCVYEWKEKKKMLTLTRCKTFSYDVTLCWVTFGVLEKQKKKAHSSVVVRCLDEVVHTVHKTDEIYQSRKSIYQRSGSTIASSIIIESLLSAAT